MDKELKDKSLTRWTNEGGAPPHTPNQQPPPSNRESSAMKIQVNTDHTIEGREPLIKTVETIVEEGLSRFSNRITRVEIHLSDVSAGGTADDKACVIEVRPNGLDPVVTTDKSDSVHKAVRSATHKMVSLLGSTFGTLSTRTDH